LRFDLRQGGAAQFKAKNGAAGRKKLLRQTLLVSQFSNLRADNVSLQFLFSRHAPEMELDNRCERGPDCSNFGAGLPATGDAKPVLKIVNCLLQENRN
jgi:hypothetical protein